MTVSKYKIIIPTIKTIELIEAHQICFLEQKNGVLHISLSNAGKIISTSSLNKIEPQLIPYPFIKIHRSIIINYGHIKRILLQENKIETIEGVKLDIARRRKAKVIEKLQAMQYTYNTNTDTAAYLAV